MPHTSQARPSPAAEDLEDGANRHPQRSLQRIGPGRGANVFSRRPGASEVYAAAFRGEDFYRLGDADGPATPFGFWNGTSPAEKNPSPADPTRSDGAPLNAGR
jgi:hypothetical protein